MEQLCLAVEPRNSWEIPCQVNSSDFLRDRNLSISFGFSIQLCSQGLKAYRLHRVAVMYVVVGGVGGGWWEVVLVVVGDGGDTWW